MYKVMMVDDDYPVLEFLSEAIPWNELGCTLMGVHENGKSALDSAKREMPDIVITDIGMPKMNGIELVRELKALHPELRVIILSCHSEFDYAKQAMQLNVQDYLIKDTFVPADLQKLIIEVRTSLDEEQRMTKKVRRLQELADRNQVMLKHHFFRSFMHQPLLSEEAWNDEAAAYGLDLKGKSCLVIRGFLDDYLSAKQRFLQDDTLRFAISNVLEEVLASSRSEAVFFVYDSKSYYVLWPFVPTLKHNPFDEARRLLQNIQSVLKDHLKLSMTFLIGNINNSPKALRSNMLEMLEGGGQRFYLEKAEITSYRDMTYTDQDLFAMYHQALTEFRQLLAAEHKDRIVPTVRRWTHFIRQKQYEPEVVKDWILKLLLDIRLKIQSLQHFRTTYSAEFLHNKIAAMDSLHQLEAWLIDHFEEAVPVIKTIKAQSQRVEVQRAYQYVADHIDKRITLDEIASYLHLNPSYFSRLFRKETGETFIEYVTRAKMERAKELLDQTAYSVSDICEMLGYDNQSYFIKTFKSLVGSTPAEYRGA